MSSRRAGTTSRLTIGAPATDSRFSASSSPGGAAAEAEDVGGDAADPLDVAPTSARRRLGRTGVRFQHRRLELRDELLDEPVADVGQDAAAELRDAAGDVEVGDDGGAGAVALGAEGGGDRGGDAALAAHLLALGGDHGAVLLLVELDEADHALVGRLHRADLHLHRALVLAVRRAGQPKPGDARGDPLDVGQQRPGFADRRRHRELVRQLHRPIVLLVGGTGPPTRTRRAGVLLMSPLTRPPPPPPARPRRRRAAVRAQVLAQRLDRRVQRGADGAGADLEDLGDLACRRGPRSSAGTTRCAGAPAAARRGCGSSSRTNRPSMPRDPPSGRSRAAPWTGPYGGSAARDIRHARHSHASSGPSPRSRTGG